jgi:DNA-binding NarL/FixJ family response regulator
MTATPDRPTPPATALELGRDAFERQAWAAVERHLTAADRERPLGIDDLERLILAQHLLGQDVAMQATMARAHRTALDVGEPERAARHAVWLALELFPAGEAAQAGAWLGRAERLLDGRPECVDHGYLLIPSALGLQEARDFESAGETYAEIERIGLRFGDRDLATIGRMGRGESLIGRAEIASGVALLDDAMLAVTAGELSPVVTGIVYCSMIETCQGIFDLRRAQEWTAALGRWCDDHPDLVRYRGECLLYRAELLQLRGAWDDAIAEAGRARTRLVGEAAAGARGAIVYLEGEVHRLRGDLSGAERAYRDAARHGRPAEPGLAMLRLAQGRHEAAAASIDRALDERGDRRARPGLLDARVRIALAAGDLAGARVAADELLSIAHDLQAPLLDALAARADGRVKLAQGEARAALQDLRAAWRQWQAVGAAYDAAGTRVLAGLACRALGDEDGARVELEAAAEVFRELGAEPDLAEVERLLGTAAAGPATLTAREAEVLRLVAQGRTNRAIADALVISEKTVARHLANIFAKLDVPSRAAATAWAYEHGVVATTQNDPSPR